MKIKTSVALDEGLMKTIDKEFGGRKNRSQLIEEAVKEYVERRIHINRDLADLEILNKKSDKLNKEAADVLLFQADL
ncbi:MAG: ribbon-helix-helix protein, CopG family [Nitrospirota bacterium]